MRTIQRLICVNCFTVFWSLKTMLLIILKSSESLMRYRRIKVSILLLLPFFANNAFVVNSFFLCCCTSRFLFLLLLLCFIVLSLSFMLFSREFIEGGISLESLSSFLMLSISAGVTIIPR